MFSITNGREAIHFEIARHIPKEEQHPYDEYFLRVWGQSSFISFDKQVNTTLTDIKNLYRELKRCYQSREDICVIPSLGYDEDFSISFFFDGRGSVRVCAELLSVDWSRNRCTVEFDTDRTFIAETLRDIRATFDA